MTTERIGQTVVSSVSARDFASARPSGVLEARPRAAEAQQNAPPASRAADPAPRQAVLGDLAQIQAMVDRVASYLNRRMDYTIEPETHAVVVRILDGDTDEVIKTIPPEQWVRLAQRFEETVGILFDEFA